MLPSNSSTFSSRRRSATGQRHAQSRAARARSRIAAVLIWTLAASILLDVTIGLAFRLPANPSSEASALQNFFDYGRSIEGKLRRLVGKEAAEDAPIVKAGWLARECDVESSLPSGKLAFDIYGMSFTNKIADQMEKLDPGVGSRRFAGPGAPPNHSYACFLRRIEANRALAPVQIMGVLASSIRRMQTLSGLTTSFEGPMPFTYPRYWLTPGGALEGHMPSIASEEDLRSALADPAKWRAFAHDLAAADYFYSRPVFAADLFDHSAMARMIRRAWGQRLVNDRTDAIRASDGFSGAPDLMPVLRAMLLDFAKKARERGARPVVILIEDRGYGGTISVAAGPMLEANDIDFISTQTIVSPTDSGNFVADGHFTPDAFEKIARVALRSVDPDFQHRLP